MVARYQSTNRAFSIIIHRSEYIRDMAFSKQQDTSGQLVQLSSANIGFALDLYQTLQDERRGTNLFFSPLSISTAMAMTQLGARGDTATQIADVFRFNQIDQDQLHGTFKELNNLLYQTNSGYNFIPPTGYMANTSFSHFLKKVLPTMEEP